MKKSIVSILYRVIVLIVLILNVFLLARLLGLIYLPGELTPLEKAKQGAQAAIKYSEEMAASYGVNRHKPVADILARFKYEIERADNVEEVASLMLDYGRQTQDIIFREAQNKRLNSILNIVNSQELPEEGSLTISKVDGKIKFLDPENILTGETKEEIKAIPFNQTIEIVIQNKRASIVTTGDIFSQVDFLHTKVASLERQLKLLEQKAGYAPMTGPGIIIKVFDNSNLEDTGIVHDADIRNLINELMAAGARGVEVGGQRLTVNSAIRCVGPTILVNNKPISVNPVIIKAVGDAQVLTSSLDIIKNQLKAFGIELEIVAQKEITLNGQRGE